MDIEENEALVAIARQEAIQAAQQQAFQEAIEKHEINEFFRTQHIGVERFSDYLITPELLDFVKRHPDIGYYKFSTDKSINKHLDEKLKKLSKEEIENLWRVNKGRASEYESYVFVKIPYSQVLKNRESKPYKRQQMQAQQNAGGGVEIVHDDVDGLAAGLHNLQVEENGNGGGGKVVKRPNINPDEELAAALAEFNLDKQHLIGGKSRRRKTKRTRKYKKRRTRKNKTRKSRRRINKKSKKNKK